MRKRHGFPGQHHLIVPQDIVRAGRRHPLLAKLLPTAAGYFPHAAGHYVVRPQGVAEVIVILCSAGRGWFELDGRRQSVETGEVAFIPPRAAHAYGAADDDPWSIVWAHAIGGDLSRFLRALGIGSRQRKLRLSGDIVERLNLEFHHVYRVMEEGFSLPVLINSSCALRLVLAPRGHLDVAPVRPLPAQGGLSADGLLRAAQDPARLLAPGFHRRARQGDRRPDRFFRCLLLLATVSAIMGMSPRSYRAIPKG
jgi:hypothetical protein